MSFSDDNLEEGSPPPGGQLPCPQSYNNNIFWPLHHCVPSNKSILPQVSPITATDGGEGE